MAGTDSPALSEAREAVRFAVQQFVQVTANERAEAADREPEPILLEAFAAYAEYSTRGLMLEDSTGTVVIVPDDQAASQSRGIFEFGADAFSRSHR